MLGVRKEKGEGAAKRYERTDPSGRRGTTYWTVDSLSLIFFFF